MRRKETRLVARHREPSVGARRGVKRADNSSLSSQFQRPRPGRVERVLPLSGGYVLAWRKVGACHQLEWYRGEQISSSLLCKVLCCCVKGTFLFSCSSTEERKPYEKLSKVQQAIFRAAGRHDGLGLPRFAGSPSRVVQR